MPETRFFSYQALDEWEVQDFLRWVQNSNYYTGISRFILWPDTGKEPGSGVEWAIVGEDSDGVVCRRES